MTDDVSRPTDDQDPTQDRPTATDDSTGSGSEAPGWGPTGDEPAPKMPDSDQSADSVATQPDAADATLAEEDTTAPAEQAAGEAAAAGAATAAAANASAETETPPAAPGEEVPQPDSTSEPPPPPPADTDDSGKGGPWRIIAGAAIVILLILAALWLLKPGGQEPEQPAELPTQPAEEDISEVVGPLWKLLEVQTPVQGNITITDPNRYTLQLKDNNAAAATADCNSGVGTYTISGLEISLDLAFSNVDCGDESNSANYIQALQDTTSYMLKGEMLNLYFGNNGTMRFTKGVVIPEAPTATDVPTEEPTLAPQQPPLAVISAPSQAVVGEIVTFDGSGSEGENEIVAYLWDFGDGGKANAVRIDHAYNTAGKFVVSLTVVDAEKQSGTATVTIDVEAAESEPPTAIITGPDTAEIDQSVTFDGSGSIPGSSPIVSYKWDLGSVSTRADRNSSTVTTSYDTPGVYQVVLTVTDEEGLSHSASHEIAVSAPLEGTEWVLDGTLPGTEITLALSNGIAAGSAGCNTYTTSYSLAGQQLTFDPPKLTAMSCAPPTMAQEQTYLEALSGTFSFEVLGEQLTLQTGSAPLTFTARTR
jgi:heat shock protein HslJ